MEMAIHASFRLLTDLLTVCSKTTKSNYILYSLAINAIKIALCLSTHAGNGGLYNYFFLQIDIISIVLLNHSLDSKDNSAIQHVANCKWVNFEINFCEIRSTSTIIDT